MCLSVCVRTCVCDVEKGSVGDEVTIFIYYKILTIIDVSTKRNIKIMDPYVGIWYI